MLQCLLSCHSKHCGPFYPRALQRSHTITKVEKLNFPPHQPLPGNHPIDSTPPRPTMLAKESLCLCTPSPPRTIARPSTAPTPNIPPDLAPTKEKRDPRKTH